MAEEERMVENGGENGDVDKVMEELQKEVAAEVPEVPEDPGNLGDEFPGGAPEVLTTRDRVARIGRQGAGWIQGNWKLVAVALVALVVMAGLGVRLYGNLEQLQAGKYANLREDEFAKPRRLTHYRRGFRLNGKKFHLLAGTVHYSRTPAPTWHTALRKVKASGLNTVVTTVPWNLHEPEPGHFNFGGLANVTEFLQQCKFSGLMVILRVGPFLGSDFDFGGLPGWLLHDDEMQIRSFDARYLQAVDKWYDVLAEKLAQFADGRPVIGMQLEHKLGSFGDDVQYMNYLRQAWERRGFRRAAFFSLEDEEGILKSDHVPGVLKSIQFRSDPFFHLKLLRHVQRTGPLYAGEMQLGTPDRWGDPVHFTRHTMDIANFVDDTLILKADFNLYMVHGGSNYGFMGGAIMKESRYEPVVTSYDCDSLLAESTNLRRGRYEVVAGTIAVRNYTWVPDVLEEFPLRFETYPEVLELTNSVPLLDVLDIASPYEPVQHVTPLHMERVNNQSVGFTLYRHVFKEGEETVGRLSIDAVRDRAYVILNGNSQAILARNDAEHSFDIKRAQAGDVLDILVENLGRLSDGGQEVVDRKGILGSVTVNGKPLNGWVHYRISLENDHELWPDVFGRDTIKQISNKMASEDLKTGNWRTPMFWRGSFVIEAGQTYLKGTYIKVEGHGMMWVNGFNVGRFWSYRGPLETLYVPYALLKEGRNRIVILQLEPHRFSGKLWFSNLPLLGTPVIYDSRSDIRRDF